MITRKSYRCDICGQDFHTDKDNREMAVMSLKYNLKRTDGSYEYEEEAQLELCPTCARKAVAFIHNKDNYGESKMNNKK